MPRESAPPPITALAEARAAARRARDWATADRLKGELEAAGWRVLDAGTLYTLERAYPEDEVVDGEVRYGASRTVPTRLEEAPVGLASVVMVVGEPAPRFGAVVRALVESSPDGTQLVIVANGVTDAGAQPLAELDAADPGAPGIVTEVVRMRVALGYAAALNAGIRRAAAPVVIVMDPSLGPAGDIVSPLVAALDDPGVAVAGPVGLDSRDLRRYTEAAPGARDAVAIDGRLMAFRRSDYVERGPLDEGFLSGAYLDAWWSLVLRDPGEQESEAPSPGRAVCVGGIVAPGGWPGAGPTVLGDRADPRARRNRYRLLKRFATRRDLLVPA